MADDTWATIYLCLGQIAGGLGYAFTHHGRIGISLFPLLAIVLFWIGGPIDVVVCYGSAMLRPSLFYLLLPALLLIVLALCLWQPLFIKRKDRIALDT